MNLIWQWIKQNPWRFLTFLVGAIGGSIAWILWPKGFVVHKPAVEEDTTKIPVSDAVKAQQQAEKDREAAIVKIEEEKKDKLAKASAAQITEYQTIRKGPPEEIAKWIDSLS